MLVEPRVAEDAPPAPDGGFVAWVQCASSFSLFLLSWGILSSFGAFQTYYENTYPSWSASQISWIGSIQAFFLMGFGVVAGPVYDRGHLRILVGIGSFLCVLGMMLTSISSEYWHFILAQGGMFGLGSGCLFIPSIAVLPAYFDKKQALALGIGASGSALGGIIFPIIFHQLEPRIGFGWTTRIIGFIVLLAAIIPVLGLRMRTQPSTVRKIFDVKAWREPPFIVSSVFFFLVFMGAYIPPFYIQSYASDTNVVGENLAPYLLPLLNVGSFFGRIIPTHMADIYGPFNVDIFCVLISAILTFIWITIRTTPSMIVFSVFYGFVAGALTSLCPNLVVALSPDRSVLGVRLSMQLLPVSAGILVGNPIAGALESYGWIYLQVFTGALLMASFIIVAIVRFLMYGKSLKVRC
ncbi:MFS monocarboxylate transporter protein [Rutstroemia sp. NJR-2017a WRK4]|nr:MFS monocarboxylate transporter protein [Rutstroemia sp. NJR-2017a WRK4]